MADDPSHVRRRTPPAHGSARTVDGRWIVAAIIALAVTLGVIGLKFRRPSPTRATQPTSNPQALPR